MYTLEERMCCLRPKTKTSAGQKQLLTFLVCDHIFVCVCVNMPLRRVCVTYLCVCVCAYALEVRFVCI